MKTLLVVLLIIFCALQYNLWFAKDGLISAWKIERMISEQKAKNLELQKQNANLTSDIEALKRGGDAIENRARSDLGMVKKGEVFYQIVK
ncbi:MAG: cell division protein FtsB [Gammaproteobacteria bacterium]|nr:cell division protein FtsB [Gammaproteobacteria bacterium]